MWMLEDVGIGRKKIALSDRSIFKVLDAFWQIRPTSEHVQLFLRFKQRMPSLAYAT